jgi:hypothetical protein
VQFNRWRAWGLGALIGLFVATREITPSSRAGTSPTPSSRAAGLVEAETKVSDAGAGCPSCGPAGLARNVYLARAEAKNTAGQAEPAAAGKMPSIVVIMGDDVGIWNIGA